MWAEVGGRQPKGQMKIRGETEHEGTLAGTRNCTKASLSVGAVSSATSSVQTEGDLTPVGRFDSVQAVPCSKGLTAHSQSFIFSTARIQFGIYYLGQEKALEQVFVSVFLFKK